MALTTGTSLGPYVIDAPIGAGGMGEVYRARDPRLGRNVAVKVIRIGHAADPDRVRRFELEARAAGMLDHPNVLAIHDVGTHDGSPYVIYELLDGQTLRERLAGGPLGVRKALDYAGQMALGLAAAHGKGIVHRDLKPENVFVTRDGRVKILDFGLAKLTRLDDASQDSATVTSLQVTVPGLLMGTVGYMSPEQIRGGPVDHRSDIFAFGAILYEMLCGRRAFQARTIPDTLTAILNQDPQDLSALDETVPPALDRIVRRCLEKAVEERFQSARDIGFALDTLADHSVAPGLKPASGSVPTRTRTWLSPLQLAFAGIVALLAIGAALIDTERWWPRRVAAFQQLTFRRGSIWSARFAPDGRTIAYGAAWEGSPVEIFSTRSDNPESRPLELTGADILAMSSTGEMALSLQRRHARWAFVRTGTLARAPLAGGAPREVMENVHYADWAPDGSALAVVREVNGRTRLEYPIGTVLYETPSWISHPRVSPNGDRVAFIDHPGPDDSGSVQVVDRASRRQVLYADWLAIQGLAWRRDGKEVWFTGTKVGINLALHAVDLSGSRRLVLRMPGRLILHDIANDGRVLIASESFRAGTIGLAPGATKERNLSWFDASIVSDLSPDGGTLLMSESGEGAGSTFVIYFRKTDGSPPIRLGEAFGATLSPDGRSALAIIQDFKLGTRKIAVWSIGAGEPTAISIPGIESYEWAVWFPDGKRVLLSGAEHGHGSRVYVTDISGGRSRPLTPEGVSLAEATAVSPDGARFVAVNQNNEAVVYGMDGGAGERVRGLEPKERPIRWSADGRALYVFQPSDPPVKLFRLDLATARKTLWKEIAPPDPAGFTVIAWVYLTPDGKSYAYSYLQQLSSLFVVEGLK